MRRGRRAVWGVVALLACTSVALAADAKVSIDVKVDPSGQNLTYIVENHADSPIVHVEFPHYAADLFTAPTGWTTNSTNLVNVGVPDEPGVCTATAQEGFGILRNRSAEFQMRLSLRNARMGKGQARVRLADGSEVTVDDVRLPMRPPEEPLRQWPVLAVAALFIGWILLRRRKGGQRPPARSTDLDERPI
jgi:hypothetical protein